MKNLKTSFPVYLSFLSMGFGDVAGPLTSQIQNTYSLSNLAAGLVTFMGFIMFGLLSVPVGVYQERKGKKRILQWGLLAALLGLIIPIAGEFSSFFLLLGALLLLGTGATLLQVAGNPIMRDVSPEGKYARNLSFGQFVKAIGSLSGALIPLIAAKYWGLDWKLLFPVYAVLVFGTLLFLIFTPITEKSESKTTPATLKSCLVLLKNPFVASMVLGIFLYVGAEVSMSAKLPNYVAQKFNFDIKTLGLLGTLFFFLSLMAGRFLGGIILNWMKPRRFLIGSTLFSLVGIFALFIANRPTTGFFAIALIGLGFANIFPLIFSITIDQMPTRSNEISGLMVTAIIGGAFVPVIVGAVADTFSLMAGFAVPALCLAYILYLAFKKEKLWN